MQFSFIHAADIHLDSPLKGLEKYEGAPVEKIRNATRQALINLIDLAIREKVDFIVIAGDLYDGDWKDYNTGLFFVSQMGRLHKNGISVYLIRGNHDAQSIITKELKLPDNVTELDVNAPVTVLREDLQTAIHGQGYSKRAVTDNIVINYPEAAEDYFNIGILHTSLTGREGHENYAPCQVEDLMAKGYDYWALGHIHLREFISSEKPVILFSGNIQGRHIHESGDKGCTIVKVEDKKITALDHHSLDVLRWELCNIDVEGIENTDDIYDRAREQIEEIFQQTGGRYLALRIHLTGSTPLHHELTANRENIINNLRSVALEEGQGDVWVEKVKLKTTQTRNIEQLKEEHTPIAAIIEYMEMARQDEELLQELLDDFKDLKNALPSDIRLKEEGLDFSDTSLLSERLDSVESLVLHYLTTKTEGGSA